MVKSETGGRILQPTFDKSSLKYAAILALVVLLTLEGRAVLSSMQRSLGLCATTIIPALFPYLAASELLVSSGAGEHLAKKVALPICTVFGISPCGAVAYVMGILCGFPVGASTAAAYARLGKISQEELARLMCFCNVPSMAFVVNVVGMSLYGSAALGWRLWGISLVSAAAVGVAYRLFCRKAHSTQVAIVLQGEADMKAGNPLSRAATGMLSVVATVLFFGALLGALKALAAKLFATDAPIWEYGLAALSACLEMSGGVAAIAALPAACSPVLCAAALGWGGLSVHYQLFSASAGLLTRRTRVRFWIARALQALLCAFGMWMLKI